MINMNLNQYIKDLESDIESLEKSCEIKELHIPHSFELSSDKEELAEKKKLLKWLRELKAFRKAKIDISRDAKFYGGHYAFGFDKSLALIEKALNKEKGK